MDVNRLVLASGNEGKVREFQKIFLELGIKVVRQADLGIPTPEEPFATFLENALVKARHASSLSGLPALADDSGICVDALGGSPGVRSARFSGLASTDEANNQLLLERLRGSSNRSCHYYCVIVFVKSAEDPTPLVADARWHGEILEGPRGSGGFGYDPIFYDPLVNKTGAEMSLVQKNVRSHRGKAMQKIISLLKESYFA